VCLQEGRGGRRPAPQHVQGPPSNLFMYPRLCPRSCVPTIMSSPEMDTRDTLLPSQLPTHPSPCALSAPQVMTNPSVSASLLPPHPHRCGCSVWASVRWARSTVTSPGATPPPTHRTASPPSTWPSRR
jgi:hypothetical protein